MLTPLNSTAELMLEQVMNVVSFSCQTFDKQKLHESLSEIFVEYEIKPSPIPEGHPDLTAKIKLFLAGKRLEGLSELTLKGYALDLRIFAEHIQKATAEITTADIRTYLGEFNRLKSSSLSSKLSVLKSFFSWLTSEDILLKDPTKRIKPPKKEKRMPKALTVEELEMIREACRTPRERAMIEVYYATGARLTEVQQLNRDDIDWQTMSVQVVGKGNKERTVYLSFKAVYHLKKYLMRRIDNESALFITERKPYRRLSNRGIQREVKQIAERSGVKKNVHPHIFRHTFATLLLNNGADLVSVQGLLGHEDPATTQIYAQVTDEKKKSAHKQFLIQ